MWTSKRSQGLSRLFDESSEKLCFMQMNANKPWEIFIDGRWWFRIPNKLGRMKNKSTGGLRYSKSGFLAYEVKPKEIVS